MAASALRGHASGAVGGVGAIASMLRKGQIDAAGAAKELDRIRDELKAAVHADLQEQFPDVQLTEREVPRA
jgi:hypothetical protein